MFSPKKINQKTNAPSNEIKINRTYDADVKTVWEAWTDVKKVAQWWGPRGFTITTHSKDLRPGGHWSYTMHSPDGIHFENKTIYHEVEKYSRLVYDHGGNDNRPPLFRVTVLFSEPARGKTKMQMTMTLQSNEAAEETRKMIKKAGGNATWDRLAEYLGDYENPNGKQNLFVIHRSFDAPIETLFEMWSNPKHFSKWLAPTGFEMQFLRADIKKGGSTFYMMGNTDIKMYGRAHYLEIEPPHRIVYTQEFCDQNEKISRHPHAPTWPERMLTTVTFTKESEHQTLIQVVWRPHGSVSEAELQCFLGARGGMTQGWTGSFDKLDDYLLENLTPNDRV